MEKEITTYEEESKVVKENFLEDGKQIAESYPEVMQAYFIGATDGEMDAFSIKGSLKDFANILRNAICLHVSDKDRPAFMDYLYTQIKTYKKWKNLGRLYREEEEG